MFIEVLAGKARDDDRGHQINDEKQSDQVSESQRGVLSEKALRKYKQALAINEFIINSLIKPLKLSQRV